ncbi:MAG: HK97 gp10 family phage protein [Sedimentibacter sp.]|uniref:HK97-gp10 family putative phage morphogenesis protein n=1 Tax=Sedimentibacter sp. TaxID=1960295 RepID=UPI0029823FA9|nr:HK97-gp10 family putative phage morphogenesis protein [Sedimentibacter sp.]MDW5300754.1 HK97 gp10 family phage protein [Sedimentibacter sp.]
MFKDNSDNCIKAIRDAQEAALRAIGELMYSAVFPLIPTDTTELQNSLDYKIDLSEMSITIGVNTEYAIYVEFGTGVFAENDEGRQGGWAYTDKETGEKIFTMGNKPQPYLRPAYRDNVENIKQIIEENLRKHVGDNFKVSIKKG